jgi:hypothetical protein
VEQNEKRTTVKETSMYKRLRTVMRRVSHLEKSSSLMYTMALGRPQETTMGQTQGGCHHTMV